VISRRTIFSFVFAALLALGLKAWAMQHRDDCDRAADSPRPHQTVYVESGTRTVEMPCNFWLPRQPLWVQFASLFNMAIAAIFLLSACVDWNKRKLRNTW
jgi:hypothetical protein